MIFSLNGLAGNSSFTLSVFGDGTATSLTVDLEALPFDLDLRKTQPAAVLVASPASGVSASLSSDRKQVTFTFTTPPPPAGTNVTALLEWASVA